MTSVETVEGEVDFPPQMMTDVIDIDRGESAPMMLLFGLAGSIFSRHSRRGDASTKDALLGWRSNHGPTAHHLSCTADSRVWRVR